MELGLSLHDHRQGSVHRRRRRRRLRSQVLLRLARRRPHRRQGAWSSSALDNKDWKPELDAHASQELVDEIYKPVRTFLEHKDYTTAIDINPHYITPKMLQFRLQKIMDEYVAGVATYYQHQHEDAGDRGAEAARC